MDFTFDNMRIGPYEEWLLMYRPHLDELYDIAQIISHNEGIYLFDSVLRKDFYLFIYKYSSKEISLYQ